MAKSLMICSNANNALKLNESDNLPSKYILEGVFAELDKLNRNQRIYQKEEYLKHLQYLRNDIKKGEPLLGELDHPDDRFEVKLKEASHRVIDLWYDADKNVVMGKIELLNTPNGKLAQSIVDQGIPLHISSRAAGTVNSDNTVSIQQIYTYDLVCKPGFAGAVLYRVDESADAKTYSQDVKSFLSNTLKMESLNSAPQYGFLNEDVSVSEIKAPAVLRKEAKEIQINKQIELNEDMNTPILENTNPDSTVGKPLSVSGGGAAALGIPTAAVGGTSETEDSSTGEEEKKEDKDKDEKPTTDVSDNGSSGEKKDDDKKENEDKEEACPKCGNKPCTCEDKEKKSEDDKEEKTTNEGEDEDKEEKSDDDKSDDDKSEDDDKSDDDSSDDKEDKKDDGVEIIDVVAEFEDGKTSDDMIKDVEAEYGDEDKDKKEDEEGSDEDKDKKEDEEGSDEEEASEAKDEDKPTDEDDKKAKEAEKLSDKASKDIEDHKDKIFKKLDDLKAAIEKKSSEKKEAKNESIIMAKYPVSMMMNESNFVEFVSLNESQKTKVVNYLQDNNFTTAQAINENWKNGVDYVAETPVWLKYAPDNYKELYEAASEETKQSINNIAKYVLFENQYDVNRFWDNSGLAEANERKLLNESFINNLPKVTVVNESNDLPYGKDFIQQVADMASEYNNRRY